MRIDIGGGLPQKLAELALLWWNLERGWRDPVRAFGGSPLFRAPASGDNAVALTTLDPPRQTSHLYPSFLPNGRQFLFYVTGTEAGIYLGSLDSRKTKRLTTADTTGTFNAQLVAVCPPRVARSAPPGSVAGRAQRQSSNRSGGRYSIFSFDRRIGGILGGTDRPAATDMVRSFRQDSRDGGCPGRESSLDPELSPDGRQVAVHRTVQGNTDVWLLDETRRTRFTFDEGVDIVPLWSPEEAGLCSAQTGMEFSTSTKNHRAATAKKSYC